MDKRQEQIEQARRLIATGISEDLVEVLYQQYPELKESKDERIRTRLIALVEAFGQGEYKDEMLSYLERQKEQKPNVELIQKSWYLEGYHDGKYNNEPKWLIQTGKGGPMYEENPKYGTQNPAEWSEEDENKKERLISIVKRALHGNKYPFLNDNGATELITWLKSLRPQQKSIISDTDKSNLKDAPAIIRKSNHPFKENIALIIEKYL